VLIDSLKSASPRFPPEFIGGFAEMFSLFRAICERQRLPSRYVERIFSLVPEPVRTLPCFLDRLTGLWRYDYGDPIILPSGSTIIGTHMFHDVERLFEVVCCASWRLPAQKLNFYLARLADRNHHEDVLVEFAPILHLDPAVIVDHEHTGLGDGNRTIDWRIQVADQPALLLEVKNRMRDLIESFEAIKNQSSETLVPEPHHDHAILFKSVASKFRAREATEVIQAAWIKTGLKQETKELQAAFDELDPARLHAVVLGSWGVDGYILGRDLDTGRRVQKILQIKRTAKLVFKRSARQN
jgi:hypothetical protein